MYALSIVLRLFRFLRVFRMAKAFPELQGTANVGSISKFNSGLKQGTNILTQSRPQTYTRVLYLTLCFYPRPRQLQRSLVHCSLVPQVRYGSS